MNQIVGSKVAIVSDRPQTTRTQIRGVRTTATTRSSSLDTPGIHKPRTLLGERHQRSVRSRRSARSTSSACSSRPTHADRPRRPLRRRARAAGRDARGPRREQGRRRRAATTIAEQLAARPRELGDFDAFVPLSARTGDGVDALLGEIEAPAARGAALLPGRVSPTSPRPFLAAELLREQLLAIARDELPHSITVIGRGARGRRGRRDADGDDRGPTILRLRAVVRVERDSQKGIVIGQGRRGAQGRRHRGPPGARGAARHAGLPRDQVRVEQGLAAPRPRRSTASGSEAPGRTRRHKLLTARRPEIECRRRRPGDRRGRRGRRGGRMTGHMTEVRG